MTAKNRPREAPQGLSPADIELLDSYWRAANYLSVGQIYLLDNPLLREPLSIDDVKPRLLGHWGTTPGLNFIYVHLNRLIRARDLDMIFITGPGHGGPALVANTWLEGSYGERHSSVTRDGAGMATLFKQFSFPGGIPSHVAPDVPGSIHEGGELGYSLAHAYGAAFDNPDLVVACIIGDGEAETGALAASWHSNKFLNPRTDGAVLPILHLNGWKIANPTVLARIPREELDALLTGYGYHAHYVEGDDPMAMHERMAATCDAIMDEIAAIQHKARNGGEVSRPRWPVLVLRTPKGWTGPHEVDGKRVEGSWRSHQVPLSSLASEPAHLRMLEEWMRSYRPEALFTETGEPRPDIVALAPEGDRRMGANPHANGGLLLRRSAAARLPEPRHRRAVTRRHARGGDARARRLSARSLRAERRGAQLPPVRSGRDRVESPGRRLRSDRSGPGLPSVSPAIPTSRRTGGSWRSCRSTSARAGWRATC
jgi:xylulose-5-phosphate/fructose-6-phosphate phosphoketolase